MERSSIRYAAVACVIAGGLLMGGTGAAAFADPGDPGSGPSGPDAPGATTDPAAATTDTSVYKTPTPGPVPVPKFNVPSRLGPLGLPGLKLPAGIGLFKLPNLGTPRWGTVTPPGVDQSAPLPGAQSGGELPPATGAPPVDGTPPAAAVTGDGGSAPPPAITLVPLWPEGVPQGKPVTIKNPLPDTLPVDLHRPIVPQVLPPPVVAVLVAMSQNVPLTDLVVSPLMNDVVVPPFIADVIVPALLSDVVVPTMALDSTLPGTTVPTTTSLSDPASWVLPSLAPPPELAPVGMDLPQGPLPSPAQVPLAPVVTPPAQPQTPPPADDGVNQLSEPVAFRAGYSDYLRNAGMAQITSIALPGIAGILIVTMGGGFIGYRQARAGHVIRAEGIARFLR